MTQSQPAALTRTLDAARRKLLETGTRNRLIHVNRDNQRASCLNIIHERSDEVWRLLRIQGKRMRFRAMGSDTATPEGLLLLAAPGAQTQSDSQLETPLGPEALARRLLDSKHMSPFEHQAIADPENWNRHQHANFRGWRQHRHMVAA